jgi:hypothetical protein
VLFRSTGAGGGFRRFVRPWHVVAAVAVVAACSVAWGFLHRNGAGGSKEIAVINAPDGPVKVKPSAETEQNAPNDSAAAVLDRRDPTPVKQVVTHQEQAVDPSVAPKVVKLGAGPVDAPHEPPLAGQPHKVKTVTVRPDGSRVDDAGLPPAATNEPSLPPEPEPARGMTPQSETGPATTTQAAKPKAKPVAKPAAAPNARPAAKPATQAAAVEPPGADAGEAAGASSSPGGYAVQFGAAGSEEEARGLLKSVAAKYGVKPTFKAAKVGEKTVYRVRVSGLSKDSALAVCNRVKSAGGSCFVAGN